MYCTVFYSTVQYLLPVVDTVARSGQRHAARRTPRMQQLPQARAGWLPRQVAGGAGAVLLHLPLTPRWKNRDKRIDGVDSDAAGEADRRIGGLCFI